MVKRLECLHMLHNVRYYVYDKMLNVLQQYYNITTPLPVIWCCLKISGSVRKILGCI